MKNSIFRHIALLFFCVFSASNIFARDVTVRQIEDLTNWQETFDINNKKKGKFNVMVTAKDKGGNTTIGGPFNIFIDPKSDLPVADITNPSEGLRVPGNLSIVGTCFDDDAVDYVELILDGDSDRPVRAEGKEFWSYFIDTSKLEEGDHTIEVYGVDINGVRGLSLVRKWCLDRNEPVTGVRNYAMGALVSGKVSLEGLVSDGNGIARLEYSLDEGVTYKNVSLKKLKNSPNVRFKFSLDTEKLEDGPAVMWFFATDKQGSVGFYPFLLFVDNTNPDLKIVYPQDKQPMPGTFTVAGYAKDIVGLKSLKWAYGKQKGEFEIVPGNSYWVQEFHDLDAVTNGKFTITAEDTVGNVSVQTINVVIDSKADMPVVNIDWPLEESAIAGNDDLFVRGMAVDDDGVTAVKIFLDGAELDTIETEGVFYKSLVERNSLGSGKHTVAVCAVDAFGVEGPKTAVSFTTNGDAPYFGEIQIVGGNAPGALPYGKEISPEQGGSIEIVGNTSTGVEDAWYSVAHAGKTGERVTLEAPKNKNENQKRIFSIPIDTLPWGVLDLTFHIKDTMGREAEYSSCVYVSNFTVQEPNEEAAPEMPDILEDGLVRAKIETIGDVPYSKGMKVQIPANAKDAPVNMVLTINCESAVNVAYKIYDSANKNAPLLQGKANVSKNKSDALQRAIIPLAGVPVCAANIEFTITYGKEYSNAFGTQICVVRDHDLKDIQDKKDIFWICNSDAYYSAESAAYILPRRVFAAYVNAPGPITANVTGGGPDITCKVEGNVVYVTCENAGTFNAVQIHAFDKNDQEYISSSVNLIAASSGPIFEMTAPVPNSWVKNSVSLQGMVHDSTGIASLEYSLDNGTNWNVIPFDISEANVQIASEINLTSISEGLVTLDLRAKNTSDMVSYYRTAIHKDITPPEIEVIIPVAEDIINGINTIAMLVKDEGCVKKSEYAPAGTNFAKRSRKEIPLTDLTNTMVGTKEQPLTSSMAFIFTDAAGNEGRINKYDFIVDRKSDLPVVEIQLPTEGQVITKDFTISGIALDDDGPCTIFYRIDNLPFTQVEKQGYSFKVEIPITDVTDNEHTVTAYAIDVNGIKGEEAVAKFHVSLKPPEAEMVSPGIFTTQKGIVNITGNASDRNDIEKVEISLDNGSSYNLATGDRDWSYKFDSRTIPDGTHVVFIRATDKYGVQSLISSEITIDNTLPEINLELPLDDSTTSGMLFFSGFALDNLKLDRLFISITSLEDGVEVPFDVRRVALPSETVLTKTVDISMLQDGKYNACVTGIDAAGNITSASRNITLTKNLAPAEVDIFYPLNGELKCGGFTIFGNAHAESPIMELGLYVDGELVDTTIPNITSYYKYVIEPGVYDEGLHEYFVRATLQDGTQVDSITQTFQYEEYGPWVRIDNFDYGDFAYDRPWIRGSAGYFLSETELSASTKEEKRDVALRSVKSIEVSWNNGRSFKQVGTREKWKIRIEDEDLANGYHFMLVRAKMNDGEVAITRCIVQIDKTAPFVRVISPGVGGRYNQQLYFSGIASDDVGLKDVSIALRKGDKSSYEVPAFFQGLYVDASFLGATLFDVGLGLTFFDDNVRIQFNFGQFTDSQWQKLHPGTEKRYGGNAILGFKIIANIANLPFGFLFGHNWDWLSMNFAVGASFKHFNESQRQITNGTNMEVGAGGMLSAVIVQLEFPRAHFKHWKAFKTMSVYTEFQLWFIPSDVSSEKIERTHFCVSVGARANVF